MISALHRWLLNRKPYTVALTGLHSGLQSPPLDYLRFKTIDEAHRWILERELFAEHPRGMTRYIVVDLREETRDGGLRGARAS